MATKYIKVTCANCKNKVNIEERQKKTICNYCNYIVDQQGNIHTFATKEEMSLRSTFDNVTNICNNGVK